MYRRPTSPDELARPCGCAELADCSNSAAEFTAPQETTNTGASTRMVSPWRVTTAASTRSPDAFVSSLVAVALVHNVTVGCWMAGRTQQMSASLFACTLHANELQVLHSMQPSSRPSGSGEGCRPNERNRSTSMAIPEACGTGGYGYGP